MADDDNAYNFIPKKRCIDIRGCGDFFIYLKQNPKTLCSSLTFFGSFFIILILALSYAVGFHPNYSYTTAGTLGTVVCLYGFCHFRTLMNLKKEVDDYSENNIKFGIENGEIASEVNRFSLAKDELKATQGKISKAIARQKVSVVKFRQLNVNLQATGKKNLELLGDLNGMADRMQSKWREELIKKERKILHICFDRFDWEDGADGISREQFTKFKMTLPLEYQLRLTKSGTWESIAGDDGILQLEEFIELLDKFAEEQIKDGKKVTRLMPSKRNDDDEKKNDE